MPRESDKTRAWEQDRRNRLNEGFNNLAKILPDYEPSITPKKLEVLQKSAAYIEELLKKVQELVSSKTSDKSKGDIIKKLQDRVKKLLNRNEQLTRLLHDAGIPVPAVFATVKKCPFWSHRIAPERAKIIQAEQEKENVVCKKPRKNTKASGKNSQVTSKPRKLPANSKRRILKPKKKNGSVLMFSKNYLVVQQPVVSQPCYVVANEPIAAGSVISTTAISPALNTSTLITNSVVQPSMKPVTVSLKGNPLSSLGPGTLIFTYGKTLPVLPRVPQIPPIPQIITNPVPLHYPTNPTLIVLPTTTVAKQMPAPTLVTNSTKLKMNNKETKSGLLRTQNVPRLRPKVCLTNTTQVNKVPIPALTSRYADLTFDSRNNLSNKNTSYNKSGNEITNKIASSSTRAAETESQKANICGKPSNKRNSENDECSASAKITKVVNEKIQGNKKSETSLQETQPLVNIIDSVCIQQASTDNEQNVIDTAMSHSKVGLEDNAKKDDVTQKQNDTKEEIPLNNELPNTNLNDTLKKTTTDKNSSQDPIDSNLNVVASQEINQNGTSVDKIQDAEQSNKSQQTSDITPDLDATITQLVPSIPDNYVTCNTNYIKTEESNIDKHTPEVNEKPDDISNDMKTLEMNLPHSELSNDIFASLQVPAGCQNPESTSPTAAFLLAFPLVSSLTGVKVTEVMDEENTESQSGTPTLLQIGTMDSTKPTQSQSESLTPSLLNLDNLSFFNTKDICNSFYTPFDNIPVSSVSNTNPITTPTTTMSIIPNCESSKVPPKNDAENQLGRNTTEKHTNVISQPLKQNGPASSMEKSNCANTVHENNKNNTHPGVSIDITSVNGKNINNVKLKSSYNVSANKVQYQEKITTIVNNSQPNPASDNGTRNKVTNNVSNRDVSNRQSLNTFTNLTVGNTNVNTVFNSSLYERNNIHLPLYERNDILMPGGNAVLPTMNTMLATSNTVLSTSTTGLPSNKSTVLPTNVLPDTLLPHQLQGTYQQNKPKPDALLKNSELKIGMNFSQNTQHNKSFNNAPYTTFPPFDTEKILHTTCVYNQISKSFMDPIYTNSNTYSYNAGQNNSYYKKSENRNYYNATYQNYEDCRKNENGMQFGNNYYSHSQSYNVKEKYTNNAGNNSNKNQQSGNQGNANQVTTNPGATNQVRPPINWMTTPDNRHNATDYVMPMFSKDNTFTSSTNYSTNSFIANNQTTYFNSNPVYSNSDIMSDTRKPLDLPLVPVNSYQRTDVEENQFPWSPTKLPQFLEPPTFVSSTLTNLIGDLALGNPNTFMDQKCDNKLIRDSARNKENLKRTKTNTSYETQSNFLSVSQLVEHNKGESAPARLANRRNSGTNRSTGKSSQSKGSKRNAKVQENKDLNQQYNHHKNLEQNSGAKPNQIKSFSVQGNDMFCGGTVNNNSSNNNNNNNHNSNSSLNQSNKNRNMNKNVPSSYSAEALIGHQSHQIQSDNLHHKTLNMQQNYPPSTKSSLPVPSFLHENIISYFPPVDIQQDNTFNQNQNYQPTSFPHNFTTTFQNNTYNNNFIPPVSTITNNYLPTNNFMHDIPSHDYLSDNLNLFPVTKDSKHYNKNSSKTNTSNSGNSREDKTVQNSTSCSNYKKTRRKQAPESTAMPNFVDFPFLSVPAAINSPILPDDFHTHASFLPPPTPSQLYPCKNPLYPKQGADLTAGPLLPLPPPVPVSKSNIQHPEISPSINTGGTSLTNFNLSTIFPEINKSANGVYNETKSKEHTPRSYTTSGSQVSFNNKSTFSLSYINCPTTQYNH